jgi:hypothetical protein
MTGDDRKTPSDSRAAPSGASSPVPVGEPSASGRPDVVVLGPPTADGEGVHVLRARDERLETGELRNLEEGRPITGEIVTLSPRKDNPRVCDVTDSYTPPHALAPAKAKGPAQVATQAYRDNWDEVFAQRPKSAGQLN